VALPAVLAGEASRRGPFLRFTKRYRQTPYTGRNLKDRSGRARKPAFRGAALFAAQEAANGAEKSGVERAGT
jgi:hypothetical protein